MHHQTYRIIKQEKDKSFQPDGIISRWKSVLCCWRETQYGFTNISIILVWHNKMTIRLQEQQRALTWCSGCVCVCVNSKRAFARISWAQKLWSMEIMLLA